MKIISSSLQNRRRWCCVLLCMMMMMMVKIYTQLISRWRISAVNQWISRTFSRCHFQTVNTWSSDRNRLQSTSPRCTDDFLRPTASSQTSTRPVCRHQHTLQLCFTESNWALMCWTCHGRNVGTVCSSASCRKPSVVPSQWVRNNPSCGLTERRSASL